MKYIKSYEGLLQKVNKFFYTKKLANALQVFINTVNPKLNCIVKKEKNTEEYYVLSYGRHLISITKYYDEQQIIVQVSNFNRYNIDINIANYILSINNSKQIIFNVDNKDVPYFISKLTTEYFDLYKNTYKYNI